MRIWRDEIAAIQLLEGSACLRESTVKRSDGSAVRVESVYIKQAAGLTSVWVDRYDNRRYTFNGDIELFDRFPEEIGEVTVEILFRHPTGRDGGYGLYPSEAEKVRVGA